MTGFVHHDREQLQAIKQQLETWLIQVLDVNGQKSNFSKRDSKVKQSKQRIPQEENHMTQGKIIKVTVSLGGYQGCRRPISKTFTGRMILV